MPAPRPSIIVSYHAPFYLAKCAFDDRDLLRRAGFTWNNTRRLWYTRDTAVAVRLFNHFDSRAAATVTNRMVQSITAEVSRRPHPEKLTLFPFQQKAFEYAISANVRYLALQQGLGKTIISSCVINHHARPAVVFCPPFLARNWVNELSKWNTTPFAPVLFNPKKPLPGAAILVVPDSRLSKLETAKTVAAWAGRYNADLVIDEAHRYKNDTAARTKNLIKLLPYFGHKLFLSGTPLLNRPFELWPLLNATAANCIDFMTRHQFGMKYCGGYHDGYGWNYKGASNVEELGRRLIPHWMMRLEKADVLDELPPKLEGVTILPSVKPRALRDLEKKLRDGLGYDPSPDELLELALAGGREELPVATYRRLVGELKAAEAIEYIQGCVDILGESVLVFAHHTSVIQTLTRGLHEYDPCVVTGSTPMDLRQQMVDSFQDGGASIFIGNIQAAGVGLTLTKATRVIFVEYSWVHAENEQAADRAHRIGQRNCVTVDYLVFKDSLDESVLSTARRKGRLSERFFHGTTD